MTTLTNADDEGLAGVTKVSLITSSLHVYIYLADSGFDVACKAEVGRCHQDCGVIKSLSQFCKQLDSDVVVLTA